MDKYQSYKPSGVEWIGEIPSNWNSEPLKYYFNYTKGSNGQKLTKTYIDDNPGIYPVYSGMTENDGVLGFVNEFEFDYPFPLIFTTTVGSRSMTTKILNGKFSLSQNCLVMIRKKECNTSFIQYFLSFDFPFRKLLLPTIFQPSLRMEDLDQYKIIVPPLHEQNQIVQFLDLKTELIDKLISTKERKITLLKEQRTSLINQVVTKGLNPNVKMKDSGVEWIGEIPDGWKIGKLYQYTKLLSGSTPLRTIPEYWENGDIPWMSSGEINKRIIKNIDGRITKLGNEKSNTPMLPINTVLIGLNGQGKTKGTVGILEVETTCNQSLCGIICNSLIKPYFLFYFLDSQYYHLRGLVGEGKREGISVSFLSLYPLLIPSIIEQIKIVEYLDSKTKEIDDLVELEQKKIDLLKEYRQSLISEVVTGKIKVTE